MILKKRLTRIIAFVISCVLVGICVFQCVFIINDNMRQIEERQGRSDVMESYDYTHDMNELFDQLWAVSSIYLRNTDSKGKYTCSKDYEKSVKQALKDLGLMDDSGRIVIDNPRNFEYYASCGDRVISYGSETKEALSSDYSLEYSDGGVARIPLGVNWYFSTDKSWYTTNYGLTYYKMCGSLPKNAVALYDFDTTGLDSYTDELGAKIYYRTDGTTPVPESLNKDNYSYESANREAFEQFDNDNENVYYVLPEERNGFAPDGIWAEDKDVEAVGDMSEVTDTDVYMFFDEDSRSWLKVSKNKFRRSYQSNSDITICIKPTDSMIAEYEQYHAQREAMEQDSVHRAMPLLPVGIAGLIIGLLLLFCCGYNAEKKKFVLSMPDHIFAELPVCFIGGAIGGVAAMTYGMGEIRTVLAEYYTNVDMGGIITGSAIVACYAIGLGSLITLSTRIKCGSLFKTSLICRIIAFIWKKFKKLCKLINSYTSRKCGKLRSRHIERNALKKDLFLRRFLIRTSIAVAAEFVLFIATIPVREIEAFFVGSVFVIVLYIIFSFRDHAEIAGVAKQIADMNGGDYSPRLVPEKSPAYGMTQNLNNISDGIRHAVDKQVQSERMKIELVTNVSHDLKTPLTSIISYIDLLSAEEMSPAARDYVTIISQKSDRLKAMVADLFDLAKATSRSDMNSEQIDAVILTQQVLGDMADRIAQSSMEVRTDIKAESAPIMADGKKLYRVMQNLIDNALKYSMAGTRIYVHLANDDKNTHISVKNISAEEMNFTPEEITERFTRGDKSRTTEGNGLGLSIAKSFTEACGGSFDIVIDGDMFTANVTLPLIENNK